MTVTTDASSKIATLTHAKSGATAKVHAYGATVLSFRSSPDGKEHLFCSSNAKLDGTKAVRGGIPIVFPIFGPPRDHLSGKHNSSTMPQHGFARTNWWTLQESETYDDELAAGLTYKLRLKDCTSESRGENNCWSVRQAELDGTDCELTLQIRLEAKQLTTTLVVKNTGTDSFDFEALLHTYLKVDDASQTKIRGLGGYSVTDKVTGESGKVQSYDDDVVLAGFAKEETDRVYIHPDDHPTLHAVVVDGKVRIEAAGQVDDNVSPVSCVVWNPGAGTSKSRAMSSDYDASADPPRMVCVEPGLLGHQPILNAGAEARLTQSIIVVE